MTACICAIADSFTVRPADLIDPFDLPDPRHHRYRERGDARAALMDVNPTRVGRGRSALVAQKSARVRDSRN